MRKEGLAAILARRASTVSGCGEHEDRRRARRAAGRRRGVLLGPRHDAVPVGEVVYLTDVEVRDRAIVLDLVSRDIRPIIERRETSQMRYKGQVELHFAPAFLERAGLDEITNAIGEFLDVSGD